LVNTDTSNLIQEVAVEPQNKVSVTKDTTDQKTDNDVKVDINMNKTKFEDPLKQKMAMARSKGPEDPPWKNVTLRFASPLTHLALSDRRRFTCLNEDRISFSFITSGSFLSLITGLHPGGFVASLVGSSLF
jgi:hypothetical protein